LYGVTNHAATGTSITCCTLFRVATAGTYTSSVVPMPSGLISQLVRGGDGAFYAALAPLSCYGCGWVFPGGVAKITDPGTFTLLGGNGGSSGVDAGVPFAVGSDGALYGSRSDESADGTIIRWDASGADTEIHPYTAAEMFPTGFTLGSDGL